MVASRAGCDAADPNCSTDGGTAAPPPVFAPPDVSGKKIAGVAQLKITIAGRDEGVLRVGLFDDAPAADRACIRRCLQDASS